MRYFMTLAALLALTACGTRGGLSQLPGPAQPPLFERWGGSPSPAKPAQTQESKAGTQSAGDLNTATEAAK